MAALPIIALVASGVGAGVSAYGAYQQGQAQQQQAQYQAAIARNNQAIANQYAQAEIQKGQVQEQEKRQQTAQAEGAARAGAGASGLDVNTDSPLRIQESIARVGEEDAQTIRNNAARSAYGYEVQGMGYAANASLDDAAAANATRFGALGAFSSIIGGASTVSDRWLNYNNKGVFSG